METAAVLGGRFEPGNNRGSVVGLVVLAGKDSPDVLQAFLLRAPTEGDALNLLPRFARSLRSLEDRILLGTVGRRGIVEE